MITKLCWKIWSRPTLKKLPQAIPSLDRKSSMTPFKGGKIAASVVGLSMLAAVAAQPSAAADFTASGRFADTAYRIGSPADPLHPVLVSLQGGSFDGTYSTNDLPMTTGSAAISSWSFNFRDSSGTPVVYPFDSTISGFDAGGGTNGTTDSLGFGNSAGYLLLEFASSFTGTGAIQVSTMPDTSSRTVTEAGTYAINGGVPIYYAKTGLNIVSGSSQAVPTPALLPGLIGLGVAALRKRRGEVQTASD
jgi:hypothetical protein